MRELFQACADKIAREMRDFGNPPVFPAHEEVEVVEEKSEVEIQIISFAFFMEDVLILACFQPSCFPR